jgi:hypothetical protein
MFSIRYMIALLFVTQVRASGVPCSEVKTFYQQAECCEGSTRSVTTLCHPKQEAPQTFKAVLHMDGIGPLDIQNQFIAGLQADSKTHDFYVSQYLTKPAGCGKLCSKRELHIEIVNPQAAMAYFTIWGTDTFKQSFLTLCTLFSVTGWHITGPSSNIAELTSFFHNIIEGTWRPWLAAANLPPVPQNLIVAREYADGSWDGSCTV